MLDNKDWWRGAVIYQIYPRSFCDKNSDGIGDLKGITAKLDYIQSLGVDAIWISPVFLSPMKDFGYDISDFRKIDPMFGNMQDFDELVEEAHLRGLKLIIDQVLNHTSDQHKWFQQSRQDNTNDKADWYVWADAKADGSEPNNWLSVFGGPAWHWDETRQQYYLHNFLDSQPDLNFHCEAVQQQVLDETEFWLQRGVDGLRLDTVNFYFHSRSLKDNPVKSKAEKAASFMGQVGNPYNDFNHLYDKTQVQNLGFLKKLRSLCDRYDGAMTLGEIGDDRAAHLMGEYTQGNDKLNMAYCFRLLLSQRGAAFIQEAVELHESQLGNGWSCWSLSNHDVDRVASRWASSGIPKIEEVKVFQALAMSLRGSVCIYNGEELGYPQAELKFEDLQDPYGIHFWPTFKGRDGCRTPMVWDSSKAQGGFSSVKPWLPIAEEHLSLAVNLQEQDQQSALSFFKIFARFRKQHQALILGTIEFHDAPKDVLVFTREYQTQAMLCLINLCSESRAFDLKGVYQIADKDCLGVMGVEKKGDFVHLPSFSAAYFKAI